MTIHLLQFVLLGIIVLHLVFCSERNQISFKVQVCRWHQLDLLDGAILTGTV